MILKMSVKDVGKIEGMSVKNDGKGVSAKEKRNKRHQAITKHLKNIYDTEELARESTSPILELVQKEGSRSFDVRLSFTILMRLFLWDTGLILVVVSFSASGQMPF